LNGRENGGKLRDFMRGMFPSKSPNQVNITDEMIRALHRAYLSALATGSARFYYTSPPGKGIPGLPDKDSSVLISSISKSTGIDFQLVKAFADGMVYLYSRGEIGQDEFDPGTKQTESGIVQTAFPKETNPIVDAITGSIKGASVVVPALVVGAGLLLVLMYVPRPRGG